MPVYEYECKKCEKVIEVQQKIMDPPLEKCPDCQEPVTKIMSMSSFQLKGGGWYADGYSSASKNEAKKESTSAPACKGGGEGCKSCPAATASA